MWGAVGLSGPNTPPRNVAPRRYRPRVCRWLLSTRHLAPAATNTYQAAPSSAGTRAIASTGTAAIAPTGAWTGTWRSMCRCASRRIGRCGGTASGCDEAARLPLLGRRAVVVLGSERDCPAAAVVRAGADPLVRAVVTPPDFDSIVVDGDERRCNACVR